MSAGTLTLGSFTCSADLDVTASASAITCHAALSRLPSATAMPTHVARADNTLTRLPRNLRRATGDVERFSLLSSLSDIVSRMSGYTTIPGYTSLLSENAAIIKSLRNLTMTIGAPPGVSTDLGSYWQSLYNSRLQEFTHTQTYLPQDVASSIAEEQKVYSYLWSKWGDLTATATATGTATGKTKTVVLTRTAETTANPATSTGNIGKIKEFGSAAIIGGLMAGFIGVVLFM
jgi:hypothetical protein